MSGEQERSDEHVAYQVAAMIREQRMVEVALDEATKHIGQMASWCVALQLRAEKIQETAQQAIDLLAGLVVKCTEYGSQDGDFVAYYILPTGPVHRAIPWLDQRGISVRPGVPAAAMSEAQERDEECAVCDCATQAPRDPYDPGAYPGPDPDCQCECHE
jgi:hypothetical protein